MRRILSVALMGAMAVGFAAAKDSAGYVVTPISGVDVATFESSGFTRAIGTATILGELPSWDASGSANNVTDVIDFGAPGEQLISAGYDVEIRTTGAGPYGGSYQSEANLLFVNNLGDGVILTPGFADAFNSPSYIAYSSGGLIDLVGLALDFPLPDGKLYLEFYEDFDDLAGAIDGYWNAGGTLDFEYTPEPASLVLLTLGALAMRRR